MLIEVPTSRYYVVVFGSLACWRAWLPGILPATLILEICKAGFVAATGMTGSFCYLKYLLPGLFLHFAPSIAILLEARTLLCNKM